MAGGRDIVYGLRVELNTGGSETKAAGVAKSMGSIGAAADKARSAVDLLTAEYAHLIEQANKKLAAQENLTKLTEHAVATGAAISKNAAELARFKESMARTDASKIAVKAPGFDTAGMAAYKEALTSIEDALKKLEKASNNVGNTNKKLDMSFKGMGNTLKGMITHARTFGASLGIYLTARSVMNIGKMADSFTELNARLKMVSGSSAELAKTQRDIYEIAQATRSPLEETGKLYFRMAQAMKDMGKSQQDVVRQTELIGKALKITGASTTETIAGLQQWSQAMSSSVLNGDEFRSVMENMPRVAKALADYFKVSIGQLREMSAQGKITSRDMAAAVAAAGDQIDAEYKNIPLTIGGAWQKVVNSLRQGIGELDRLTGASSTVANILDSISKKVDEWTNQIRKNSEVSATSMDAEIERLKKIRDELAKTQDMPSWWDALFGKQELSAERLKYIDELTKKIDELINKRNELAAATGAAQLNLGATGIDNPLVGNQLLTTGRQFLGYSEQSNDPNKPKMIDFLNKYSGNAFKDIAGDVNAWCAAFVSAVLKSNSIENPQSKAVKDYLNYGQEVWKKADGVKGLGNLRPGDIAVFKDSGESHVAFVDSVDLAKNMFTVLGGNQGKEGAVTLSERTIKALTTVRRPLVANNSFFDPHGVQTFNTVGDNLTRTSGQSVKDIQEYMRSTGGTVADKKTIDNALKKVNQYANIVKMIADEAKRQGFDPALAVSVAFTESKFASDTTSPKGAKGIFQFMPARAAELGLRDRTDPAANIVAGIKNLMINMGRFKQNPVFAVAAHNAGQNDTFLNDPKDPRLPPNKPETLNYVEQIFKGRGRGGNPGIAFWKKLVDGVAGTGSMSGQPAMEELQKQNDIAYKNFLDTEKAKTQIRDAEAKKQQAILENQLKAEQANIDKYNAKSQIEFKTAIDQGDIDAQKRLIDEMQKKNEESILKMNEMAGQKDTYAGVRKAREELKSLDREIKMMKDRDQPPEAVDLKMQERLAKQKELEAAQIEAKGKNIDLDKLLFENQQKYDDMRREAQARYAEQEQKNTEEAMRWQKEMTDAQLSELKDRLEGRKEAIELEKDALTVAVSAREQARQAALEGKVGYELGKQYLENEKAQIADKLALIEQERRGSTEKLAIEWEIVQAQKSQLEQQMKALDNSRAAIELMQDGLAKTEQLNAKDHERYALQQQIAELTRQQETMGLQKAQIDATADQSITQINNDTATKQAEAAIQKVAEEQLRLNQAFEDGVRNAQLFAAQVTEAFGPLGESIGKLVVGFEQFQQQSYQVQRDLENAQDKIATDMKKGVLTKEDGRVKEEQEVQKAIRKTAYLQIQLYGDMADAAKGFFKENSKGYKFMENAAKTFRNVQMIMKAKEVAIEVAGNAKILASDIARTVTEIFNSKARGTAKATEAVANQAAGGDAYSAWIRMAAMAAVMAAIGYGIAGMVDGGGGGQTRESAADRQAKQFTGTVLGDSEAQSESLMNSLEIVADNSSADLDYSRGMLRALVNIESLLGGASASVAANVMTMPNMYQLGKNWEVSDIGVNIADKTLGQYLGGGKVVGSVITEIKKELEGGKAKYKDLFSELSNDVEGQFTRVILSLADTVSKAGTAFGVSADDFQRKMMSFVVSFGTVSFGDLKGEDLEKAVQQMFSKMSDEMAMAFMPGLQSFQRVGEGYLETVIRVGNSIDVATGLMDQLGISVIKYTDVIMRQGDIAAEMVRQSLINFEGANSAIGKYLDQVSGTAEELIEVYKDLLDIRDIAAVVGMNFKNLSNEMVIAAGGVAALKEAMATYQTEFFGQGAEYAQQLLALQRSFSKLGLAVPASREAFVSLVDSIDTSTEAGQKLYAQLISLAGAFAAVKKSAAEIQAIREKYLPTDSMASYRKQIEEATKDFGTILDAALAEVISKTKTLGNYNLVTRIEGRRNKTAENRTTLFKERDDLRTKRAGIDADIAELEAIKNRTKDQQKKLRDLRKDRANINSQLAGLNSQIMQYNTTINNLDKTIAKAKGKWNKDELKRLEDERAAILKERGDAIIKTMADIWDKMTQAINSAKETLANIKNSIFELTASAGSADLKFGMANAKRITAEASYNAYSGNDIQKLNQLASDYYNAIMAEYQAKMDLIEEPKKALEKERELRQKAHDKEITALQKQLDKVKELYDAVESIKKFALDLKLGGQTTLSPEQQLKEAQKQYNDLLMRAQGGDAKAIAGLGDGASKFLELAQKFYGSGAQYASIYDGVLKSVEAIGGMNVEEAQTVQDKIDKLNEEHEVYLKSIDDQIEALHIEDQIKELQNATAAKLQLLADDLGPKIQAAEDQAKADMQKLFDETVKGNQWTKDQLDVLKEMAKSMGLDVSGIGSGNGNGSGSGTGNGNTGGQTKYDGPSAYGSWDKYWKQARIWWKNHFKEQETWKEYKLRTVEDLKKQGMHPVLPAFAAGGYAQAGMALVGEKGPEIVRFERPAQVLSAADTREALSGSPKTYQALEEIKMEMRALVTTQSGANPQIINRLNSIEERLNSIERMKRTENLR